MSTLTLTVLSAKGKPVNDRIEVRSTQTPDAAFAAGVITKYQLLIKGSVSKWTSSQDVALTTKAAAVASSSKEVEGAVQVLKSPKGTFTHKIPHPIAAAIVGNSVDINNAAILAWVNQFLVAGKTRFSDGNYMLAGGIIRGFLKPKGRRKSTTRKPKT